MKEAQCATCGTNPMSQEVQKYMYYLQNQNQDVLSQLVSYQDQSATQQALTICGQFSQASCCTQSLENSLKLLAYQYYQKKSNMDYFFTQLSNSFSLEIQNCTGTQYIPFITRSGIDSFNTVYSNYKMVILKLIKANVQLIRGNLCLLCADPNNINSFIDTASQTIKIKVQSSPIEAYINNVAQQFQTLQSLTTQMKQGFLDYYNIHADNSNCGYVITQTFEFLNNLNFCKGLSCKDYVQGRMGVLIQGFEDELSNLVIPNFYSNSRSDNNQNKLRQRQLSFALNYLLSGSTGLNTFFSQDIDQNMTYMGIKESKDTKTRFGSLNKMVEKTSGIKNVHSDDAPKAIGPYVQGKIVPAGSDLFYSSGVIGLDPKTMNMVSDDVEGQTEQVMKSMQAILKAAGTSYDNVIKVLLFLDDMEHFPKVNKIYESYFSGDNKPARSTVAVKQLPKSAKIEMECIAYVPKL